MTKDEIKKLKPGEIVVYKYGQREEPLIVAPGGPHGIMFVPSNGGYWGSAFTAERYRPATKREQDDFMMEVVGIVGAYEERLEEVKEFRRNCFEWREEK